MKKEKENQGQVKISSLPQEIRAMVRKALNTFTEEELNGICAACNGWMFKYNTDRLTLAGEIEDYFNYNRHEAEQFWKTPEELEETIKKITSPLSPSVGLIFFYVILFWGGYDAEDILEDVAMFFVRK